MNMTNDSIYRMIKSDGIKQVAKNYFSNIEDEHWVVWLRSGETVLLNKSFLRSYSITSCFDENSGELILKNFVIQKIPRKVVRKALKEKEQE